MSVPIRLFVSDIDGTLVRQNKSLSEAVVAAVARCRAAGIIVSLISARPPSGMLWIAERLGLTCAIGAFNGGTVVQAGGRTISAARLDPPLAARALALLDTPGVTPWLFADGKWYAKTTDNAYVPRERKAANVEPVILADFAPLLARADKIVGVSDEPELLRRIDDKVAAAMGEGATVARSQPYYLDITAPRANKGDGVKALAAALGIPMEAVAVIGDQRNDLAMFAVANLSIAMGQAPDEVRAAADHVVASNEEDGVAEAIDRYIIPAAQA